MPVLYVAFSLFGSFSLRLFYSFWSFNVDITTVILKLCSVKHENLAALKLSVSKTWIDLCWLIAILLHAHFTFLCYILDTLHPTVFSCLKMR